MHKYILSLGSNIAPRLRFLRFAAASLILRGEILEFSSVYETSPVGMGEREESFLNAVLAFRTYLDPPALLRAVKNIEESAGRVLEERYKARTLDIDIIAWSGGEWHDERLDVPHPRAHERLFVLVPYVEICKNGLARFPELDAGTLGGLRRMQDLRQGIEFFCGGDMLFARAEEEP
ncbi:MAG: 2-amino-4-hydroxy-6-hydroxymethyldihydropteridine diphosphokinase [Spirochaetota bacterium]|jgi:2-amino-4-hydroxy-6-hydroxymethyldihydropteridine diphosphokinase|nr:2-amino-4-hydroxy-6-hydroxymethyldihydropteridine diphosphokinase [Spirochaetota bacterium]